MSIHPFLSWLSYFFIYSFLGWVCECIYCSIPAKHFINRGFLYGSYCPIYGFGAICVIWMLEPFLARPLLLFLLGILLTSTLEYFTSWVMELCFHTKWWDYTGYFLNLHGRICIKNSLLFGILVLTVLYGIHPFILDALAWLPSYLQLGILFPLTFFFLLDGVHTIITLIHRNQIFHEMSDAMEELRSLIYAQGRSLSELLQEAFSLNDSDERIHTILQRISMKVDIPAKYAKQKKRLENAFPNQHLSHVHAGIEQFIKMVQEYYNNRK